MIIKSLSLPYFSDDKVYIWALNIDRFGDKQIICRQQDFKDITSEGGRSHQIYTYRVKKILNDG